MPSRAEPDLSAILQLCAEGKAGQAQQRWAGRTGGHKDNNSVRNLSLAGSGFLINLNLRGKNCGNLILRRRPPWGKTGNSKFGVPSRPNCEPTSPNNLYGLCPRSPVAAATRGAGLVLLSILTATGGTVIIKHRPGVRCCGLRGGLFCYLFVATGRGGNREENKERPGR